MIGIVGGGNIGTELAGELTHRGFSVALYSKDISCFLSGKIKVIDNDRNEEYVEKIDVITSSLKEVVDNSDIIIVTYPSNAMGYIKDELISCLKKYKNKKVIFLPGIGGVEYIFKELVDNGSILIGLQRVPAVYRIKEKGKIAEISGRRKEGLFAASIPQIDKDELENLITDIFGLNCQAVPNYLSITLTPSNPILHTSRLFSLFNKNDKDFAYDKNPLFYGEWDENSAEVLISCDSELGKIKEVLSKKIDVSFVESLLDHYESSDKKSLANKISSIKSLHNLTSPMLQTEDNKFLVDWSSRYFKADFPNGLVILKAIGMICNVLTPVMDKVIMWYQEQVDKEYITSNNEFGKDIDECNIPQNYGINSLDKLIRFYQ